MQSDQAGEAVGRGTNEAHPTHLNPSGLPDELVLRRYDHYGYRYKSIQSF